jgi:hypothetical protein
MRRIASEKEGLSSWRRAQASTAFRTSGDMRNPTIGSKPVAGRPLFFRLAGIDFAMTLR